MSANRRHRRGRVWTTAGLVRCRRGLRRETNRQWDKVTKDCARLSRMRAYRSPANLRFRNDSGRTIRAGEMVWLTDTGGVKPVELLEQPLASASMSYSWINPNGEVVRHYLE